MDILRRLVHALLIVLSLLVGATAAAVIVTQTAWFKNLLRVYIVREANEYLNGQVSIERLGGNLFSGIEMENVGVSLDGNPVVAVKDLGLDYSILELVSKGLAIDKLRVNGPVLYLRHEGDSWSISRLIKKQTREAERRGPERSISIGEIGVSEASVVVDRVIGTSGIMVPRRFDDIDAKLSFKYEPVHYSVEITHLSFRGSDPVIALNALSGGVAVKDDTLYLDKVSVRTAETSLSLDGAVQQYLTKPIINLHVSSDKTSLREIGRIVPALARVRVQPAFDLRLDGPLDRLGVDVSVQSSAGRVSGQFLVDVDGSRQSVVGTMSVRHLDLAAILNDNREKSDITADFRGDLRAKELGDLETLQGTVSMRAPRLAARGFDIREAAVRAEFKGRSVDVNARASGYGADFTSIGFATIPRKNAPVTLDLRGTARHVDVRKLPASLGLPPADTNITGSYHIAGTIALPQDTSRNAAAEVIDSSRTSVEGDARLSDSIVAGARIADGSTLGWSLKGAEVAYRTDANVTGVNLQRIGKAFGIPALANDRFAGDLSGHVKASGNGAALETMRLDATGELTDSIVDGGRLSRLGFDVALSSDTAHVAADGSFSSLDPAVLSGKPAAKGSVTGTVDLDANITNVSAGVTMDSVAGTLRATLGPSTIGGVALDWAYIDGDYDRQSGTIRDLEVVGRDLNVEANGTVALGDGGQSNLTFKADTPSLDEVGKIVDLPLSGIAKVDGTITGNRTNLQAKGNLVADGVKYGDNGALTLTSDYSITVPDLVFDCAKVSGDVKATFVTLAGQNINELTANTTYEDKQLAFDATAKQPERSLGIAGSMLIHPDHQEFHVQRLLIDAQGTRWELAAGSRPAIQYGNDIVAIKDLKVVSGGQQVSAEGRLGKPGDNLNVVLENVELASVDTLLLRPPQFSGRLSGSGTVTGTKDAPRVNADFLVNQGGFRQFKYDSFGGTMEYSPKGIALDAKLQQNQTQWFTAKGHAPLTLLTSLAAGGSFPDEAVHRVPASPDEQVDLTIDSTPIDLGVVQGFTTALTGVTGTLEAHVHVTGSGDDPHPDGTITISKGTATVVPTGVRYTDIGGRIDLQSDHVHTDAIVLLDNQRNALSIVGGLDVHQREIGGIKVYVNSDDFKIIDNKLGNVRIQSTLEIVGDLRAPRIEGDLSVTTGWVDLDRVIAEVASSPYALSPVQYAPGAPAGAAEPEGAALDVHVTVPDDLVIRASTLQTSDSPIGLGSLNLTLGGDLRTLKDRRGQVRFVGTVNTVRGTYNFQGRRFEMLRDGTVNFEGLTPPNPRLNVSAQRLIQGVETRVNIRGTLQEPEIVLSSTPPLEPADILALIVFNQPLNELGEGQQLSLAARAQSLAANALTSELSNSIATALHLETFELELAPDHTNTAGLTVGQQVGSNLYVKVEQQVGDQSTTNFIVEYELARWLRLRTNVLEGSDTQQRLFTRAQGSGADLLFFLSY